MPRCAPEARQANQAVVDLVRRVADAKGATPGQVALAWLLAEQPWIEPIPGTRRPERLEEDLGAADLGLTAQDVAELDETSAQVDVVGERCSEAGSDWSTGSGIGRPRARWSTARRRGPARPGRRGEDVAVTGEVPRALG